MDYNRLLKISAVAGTGLVIIGGVLWYRQWRTSQALAGIPTMKQLGMVQEAPVVSSYSDGNMKTEIRSSPNMPIEQRLATIQRKVRESIQDPEMRKLALKITASCPERDKRCEAKAIYKWMKKNIRYTGDIAPVQWEDGTVDGVDLYQSARRTVEFGGGDCDDHSILGATLLSLNGIEAQLAVTAEAPLADDSHIYVGGLLPDFTALDTTLPGNFKFGVEAPYARRRFFAA